VQGTRAGDAATLNIWRKGQLMELRAIIGDSDAASLTRPTLPAGNQGAIRDPDEILKALGIEVRDLLVPERMGGLRGVVVTAISDNGLAVGKLQTGDLIIAVQNARISGASEFFLHLAASVAVQETAIHLMRDGRPLRISIPAIPRRE
jgi:serine protease Do